MVTVHETTAAIPKLSKPELDELRASFDDYWEDQLELTIGVKTWIEPARRDIPEGRYRTRPTQQRACRPPDLAEYFGRRTRPPFIPAKRPQARHK